MSFASAMLRRRSWPARRRRGSAVPRWRALSRALRDRYRHRRSPAGFVERVLLHRPRALERVTERWVLAARATHPRVALTVQPLLRLRFAWTFPGPVTGAPVPARPAAGSVRLGGRPASAAAGAAAIRSVDVTDRTVVVRAAAAPRPGPAPCARVFARARGPHEILAAPSAPHTLERARLATTRTDRLRRREERGAGIAPARVTLRESAPARVEPVQATPDPFAREGPAPRRPFPAPAVPDMAALPAPQLQALTERVVQQIDRRLSAWRERSGLA